MSAELADARGSERSRPVRVTGHPYIMEHIIRPILADFTARNPQTSIEVVPYTSEVMRERETMTRSDIAFVTVDSVDEVGVEMLRPMKYGLIVSAGHPLARRARVTPQDIGSLPFILPLAGTMFEQKVLQMLSSVGCDTVVAAARAQQADIIKDLVLKGVGIAHLPLDIVGAELASGLVHVLPIELPDLYLGQIAGARAMTSARARSLLSFARTVFSG